MSGNYKTISTALYIMAASSLTPFNVFAKDPDLSFYPVKKWAVENLTKAGEKGVKICSVSGAFNNGFSVQIEGSQEEFSLLKIDFKQNSFEQSKSYDVQYTLPGSAEFSIPTRAAQKNLLVANLRGQTEFSGGLPRSGVLDVKIQKNEFRLYLTGLEAAMKSFRECVQPEGGLPAQAAAPAQVIETHPALKEPKLPETLAAEHLAPPPPLPTTIDVTAKPDDEIIQTPTKAAPASTKKPDATRERFTEKLAKEMKSPPETISVPVTAKLKTPAAAPAPAVIPEPPAQNIAPESAASDRIIPEPEVKKTALKAGNEKKQELSVAAKLKNAFFSPFSSKNDDDEERTASAAKNSAEKPALKIIEKPAAKPEAPIEKTAMLEPEVKNVPAPIKAKEQSFKIKGAVINQTKTERAEIDLTQIEPAAPKEPVETFAAAPTPAPVPPVSAPEITTAAVAPDDLETSAQHIAQIEPGSGTPPPAMIDHAAIELRNKIIDLEQQISVLRRDNAELDVELKSTLKDAADERTTISSSNWDLERATMRYNEAEMQISRLGRQLQSSKSQCEMEKSELKTMLFDPKLTDQQQLAKLSSLEGELDQTKTDLIVQKRTYEERIRLLEEQLNKKQ